jgi:DNA-binding FadR family transcriptional regulator
MKIMKRLQESSAGRSSGYRDGKLSENARGGFQDRKLKPPRSYADKIAEILRAEIERGLFRPGERLPTESEIGTNFGVSRTVVREAISALKHDGYLETFQGRGIFVAERKMEATFKLINADLSDAAELNNILDFLIANEVAATGLAAERRSKNQLADITSALRAMEEAIHQGKTGIDEDLRFHASIVAASMNPYFISFNAFLENRVRHLIRTARIKSSKVGLTLHVQKEHQAIFDAIERGNKGRACSAAEAHLRNAAARLQTHYLGNKAPRSVSMPSKKASANSVTVRLKARGSSV